ncbi:hypothetical protein A2U01_0116448, partial [Trifolium medium]|nr:hypothetical protein [Trifolium medium]
MSEPNSHRNKRDPETMQ